VIPSNHTPRGSEKAGMILGITTNIFQTIPPKTDGNLVMNFLKDSQKERSRPFMARCG